jgi:hypothetical protein
MRKGKDMRKLKTSISRAGSYKKIADFWDTHDLSDFWGKTRATDFQVDIQSEVTYYSLDKTLSKRVQSVARNRGISTDTLINLWIQEKLQEQNV